MATPRAVLVALRATLAGVSGLVESQQVQDEHRAAPELDRSWTCDLLDTTTTQGRVRGVRHLVSRLQVLTAHRIRTPGPQLSRLDALDEEETIREALEGTTAAGVSGVRVERVQRSTTGDRQYHLTSFDVSCSHTD